jgi:hypothetical protein
VLRRPTAPVPGGSCRQPQLFEPLGPAAPVQCDPFFRGEGALGKRNLPAVSSASMERVTRVSRSSGHHFTNWGGSVSRLKTRSRGALMRRPNWVAARAVPKAENGVCCYSVGWGAAQAETIPSEAPT